NVVVHARIDRERLDVAAGGLAGADLVIEAGSILPALMAGEGAPAAAIKSGEGRLTGDAPPLDRFVWLLQIRRAPPRSGGGTPRLSRGPTCPRQSASRCR